MNECFLFDAAMSPAGFRSRLALKLANCDYKRIEMDLGLFDQKSDRYINVNPTGQVPTLLVGSEAIFDSHTIVDAVLAGSERTKLLDERFGRIGRAELQNIERAISQIMRPAVYETVGCQRLKSRFESWESLEADLVKRGVSGVFTEFSKDLFFKEPDTEVIESVVELLDPVLNEVSKIIQVSRRESNYAGLNYFDVCIAPRLNVINLLGLDSQKRFETYLDILANSDIWKDVSCQGFDMKFHEFREAL
ncbi:glutathione S-transferase family protein [Marinobacter algicola]|uniref:glutathione S-transferase family protein n=1 Tax=Marinobacter algicola TaxID=236100 RepID=UPI003BAA46C4